MSDAAGLRKRYICDFQSERETPLTRTITGGKVVGSQSVICARSAVV